MEVNFQFHGVAPPPPPPAGGFAFTFLEGGGFNLTIPANAGFTIGFVPAAAAAVDAVVEEAAAVDAAGEGAAAVDAAGEGAAAAAAAADAAAAAAAAAAADPIRYRLAIARHPDLIQHNNEMVIVSRRYVALDPNIPRFLIHYLATAEHLAPINVGDVPDEPEVNLPA